MAIRLSFLLRLTILVQIGYIVSAKPYLEVERPRGTASIDEVEKCVVTSKTAGSAVFRLRHLEDITEANHTDKAIEISSLRCGDGFKFGGVSSYRNEEGEMCQLIDFNDNAAKDFNDYIQGSIPTVKDVLYTPPWTTWSQRDNFDKCKAGVEELATKLGVLESKLFKKAKKNKALIKNLCSLQGGAPLPQPPQPRRPSVDSTEGCVPSDFCPSSDPGLVCCGLICTGIVIGIGVAASGGR